MTVKEIASQLMDISVDGVFNGQKFTVWELQWYIENMFRSELGADKLVMQITLPDGLWMFTVNRWGDGEDCFDYVIPDTREEEDRVWSDLMKGVE